VITRLAPTPSGFLHTGNLVNFALTARLARENGAEILLRIDDADTARIRQAYVQDVFDALSWLGISWSIGPRTVEDVPEWSQKTRQSKYRRTARQLHDAGAAYVCQCSRAQWADYGGAGCPQDCESRQLTLASGENALRLAIEGSRDVVLWRREDGPSYHLASIVDDDHFGVDLVVRGADLEESTDIQRAISRAIPGSRFHEAEVVHHGLLTDDDGRKLSKSAGHGTTAPARSDALRSDIDRYVNEFLGG
jgi:glutamyl-tRNA synthetase